MSDSVQVGDRVRVTTKSPESYIHATQPFRYNTYEGTVVRGNVTLDPPGTFNLLTGNPEFPVSIIDFKHVEKIEHLGSGTKIPILANRTRYIIVQTDHNTEHRVGVYSTGHLDCDCASFLYRKSCTHTKDAESYLVKRFGLEWVNKVFK